MIVRILNAIYERVNDLTWEAARRYNQAENAEMRRYWSGYRDGLKCAMNEIAKEVRAEKEKAQRSAELNLFEG